MDWRRARHVVTENARVLAAVAALARGDVAEVGRLFAASQRSMAEDFEISTPEIDTLVALAVATPGVVASRLTGGGFGGCTVSLVDADRAPAVAADLLALRRGHRPARPGLGLRPGRRRRGLASVNPS